MRLSEFVRQNHEKIGQAWEQFARELTAFSQGMNLPSLRDDLDAILEAIADDMELPQDAREQGDQSKGRGGDLGAIDQVTAKHVRMRLNAGFNLRHVLSEYRALRASVLSLYAASGAAAEDLSDLSRFNEAIDQAIAEILKHHEQSVTRDTTLFLAILAHDIRNPLNTISLAANVLNQEGREPATVARIQRGVLQANRLVDDLGIFVRSRLGTALPLSKSPADLRLICEQVLEDARGLHTNRTFKLIVHGDLTGNWDSSRLVQVLTNLLGNAAVHGSGREIDLEISDEAESVVIKVTNRGNAIAAVRLGSIFDPMVRNKRTADSSLSGGMGLGLFIVREIVSAHGGRVEVVSSAKAGTTFTIYLPR
jgi:signal transduction histidine kinase